MLVQLAEIHCTAILICLQQQREREQTRGYERERERHLTLLICKNAHSLSILNACHKPHCFWGLANPMGHSKLLLRANEMLAARLPLKLRYLKIKTEVCCAARFSTPFQPPLFLSLTFLAAACGRNCIILATTFHLFFLNILPHLKSALIVKRVFFSFHFARAPLQWARNSKVHTENRLQRGFCSPWKTW